MLEGWGLAKAPLWCPRTRGDAVAPYPHARRAREGVSLSANRRSTWLRAPGPHYRQLPVPVEPLEGQLGAHGRGSVGEGPARDELDRSAGARVLGALAGLVLGQAALEVDGVASVEAAVGAAQDVDVVCGGRLCGRRLRIRHRMGPSGQPLRLSLACSRLVALTRRGMPKYNLSVGSGRGGRAVYGGCLENSWAMSPGGSNPSLSAKHLSPGCPGLKCSKRTVEIVKVRFQAPRRQPVLATEWQRFSPGAQEPVQPVRGILLQRRQDVAVGIQGEVDTAVAQPLGDDLSAILNWCQRIPRWAPASRRDRLAATSAPGSVAADQ